MIISIIKLLFYNINNSCHPRNKCFYMLFTVGDKAPPHPPFIINFLSGSEIGSPHPPRIARRLVRLVSFLCLLVLRLFLRVVEKGFKEEINLVNPIIK